MSTKQIYDRIQNTSAGDTDRILDIMLEIVAEIDRLDRDLQFIRSMQGDILSDEAEGELADIAGER